MRSMSLRQDLHIRGDGLNSNRQAKFQTARFTLLPMDSSLL